MSLVDGRVEAITRAEPGESGSGQQQLAPRLVRVSVLGGNTQLDVGLPAGIPIAALIGDLVAHIESRDRMRPDTDDEGDPRDANRPHNRQDRWTLAPVGGEPMLPNRSLSESGVRDGDLLLLTSARTGDSPVLFDDVVDAVAQLNESSFASFGASAARRLGQGLAMLAAIAAAATLGTVREFNDSPWIATLPGALACALVIAALVVARHYRDQVTATVLTLCAMPQVFIAGMLCVPGDLGMAHLTLGFGATLLASVASYRLTGVGPAAHTALITACVIAGLGCGACLLTESPVAAVSAVMAVVGLVVVALSPRATIVLAKLPVPPVPTAGAAIDLGDEEPRPTIEGIGAIGAMALPKADALERRSHLANAYLTGIVIGATATTAVCAVLAADMATGFAPKSVAFTAIIAAVLCLRGRSHSDLAQAVTLIVGGSLTLLALIVGLAFGGNPMPLVAYGLALLLVVAALVFGVIAPGLEFSPVLRRSVEVLEYALVVTIVPLLLWILDLYRVVREI